MLVMYPSFSFTTALFYLTLQYLEKIDFIFFFFSLCNEKCQADIPGSEDAALPVLPGRAERQQNTLSQGSSVKTSKMNEQESRDLACKIPVLQTHAGIKGKERKFRPRRRGEESFDFGKLHWGADEGMRALPMHQGALS